MSNRQTTIADYALLADELAALARQIDSRPPSGSPAGSDVPGRPAANPPADIRPPAPYPVLSRITAAFGLTPFERSIVLAAAGMELDSEFAGVLSRASGNGQHPVLTFGLALARLPEPHWSALAPSSPLRRWRLVWLGDGPGLINRPIHLAERVLHAIAGVDGWDCALERVARQAHPPRHLAPSHCQLAAFLARLWFTPSPDAQADAPGSIAMLCGHDARTRRDVAAAASASLGLRLSAMDLDALPARADERDELARIWDRDAALEGAVMFLEAPASRSREAIEFVDRLTGLVALSCDAPIRASHRASTRSRVRINVAPPSRAEQTELWQQALGANAGHYADAIVSVVDQFCLGASEIHDVAAALSADQGHGDRSHNDPKAALWHTCRTQSRPRLDGLAERMSCRATWSDLVLPDANLAALRAIVAQVRQRDQVYQKWGYERAGSRGLGVTALFSGPSGTGKTLAAEVLANALELDLYRIDLSGVVSKYIGETEKNLQQVFDAAEAGGVVLLFDEADALFGKRSEVKDSHDRHANIEVGYLLQRMESYRGLAILTTNMRAAIDDAFLRRIRFAIELSFPDATQRAEIWRQSFPKDTPTEGLDIECLAEIQLCGGNIRNVSLNAAFLAADADQPVTMEHVLDAARAEFVKLERPFSVPSGLIAKQASTKSAMKPTRKPSVNKPAARRAASRGMR